MPRYHLHVHNSFGTVLDEEGQDLTSLADAERVAIAGVRAILADEVTSKGSLDLRGHVEIAAEDGNRLSTVKFCDAVDLRLARDA